jgi:two-component system, OmpR family, KDP operon response regulator KdpE
MTEGTTLLIIEDEASIRHFLRATLASQGYGVLEAATAAEGMQRAASERPALILLDLGLPDLDGLEVTKRLRTWTSLPIVVLSARGQERDKVAALDAGADDYLTKPFGVDELLARIRVALRHATHRGSASEVAVVKAGELRIDLVRRQVSVGGKEVHLTPIQYQLLVVLAQQAGSVVTHTRLLKTVWGPNYERETQYLRVYMGQLRQKLEVDPARPRYLLTEPGVGYRLAAEP